jgi:hypothetical protein
MESSVDYNHADPFKAQSVPPAQAASSISMLMDIDAVQKALNRSRPSVYRYANTDPHNSDNLNLPFDPKRLNPEHRLSPNDPLRFHPNEVARFARDVLGIRQVTIEVQEPAQTATNQLLQAILTELQAIHQLLQQR